MPSSQETRFREHLAQLRQASRGLGKDIEAELTGIEKKIDKGAKRVAWGSEDLAREIDYELAVAAVRIQKAIRTLPSSVKSGSLALGSAVKRGSGALKDRTVAASARMGKATKKGVKKGLSKAAGTWHEPLQEWSPEGGSEE